MSEIYEFEKIEKQIKQYWEKEKIPQEITNFNKSTKKKFYLLDGPPYANGMPHAGHVMTIIFKDIWGKFKTMKGYDVWYQPGFDCHGLPIENKVEKILNVKSKQDIIEKIGEDKFIDECRKFSIKNLSHWMDFYKQIAAWKGWIRPYLTYEDYYIESGWWTIKSLYQKGLIIQGEKSIHWCPKCQTSLSGYEVTDSYKYLTDPSVYLKFKILGKENEYLLVWTTTPWTLPSNVALLVHPDEVYAKVKVNNEIYILAEKRLKYVFEKKNINNYEIIGKLKGSEFSGLKYMPLLDVQIQKEISKNENTHRVYLSIPILKKNIGSKLTLKKQINTEETSDFGHLVDMESGTGIVHIAPGHGVEDNKIGKYYHLPQPSPLDDKCCFRKEAGFSGFVKEADKDIISHLIKQNKMFFNETIVHSYPICWRCKTPLIFRLSRQWFFPIETFHQHMMAQTTKVKFLPDFSKTKMLNWLADSGDWCISIQRFWGIPIPIWKCDKCRTTEVIGSKKELQTKTINNIELNDDLHKNIVDKIILKCPECGNKMKRIPDLVNIWVESGISPWASLGYPNKKNNLFEKLKWVDLVNESQDQIRGWFYAMMFMGNALFEKSPYKICAVNGWTLDKKGEKMSKSLGNVISAEECIKELGIDVLRFYTCYNIAPWETHKFNLKEAKKITKMMNILNNICTYIEMYKIDISACLNNKKINDFSKENKWIISVLNTLLKETKENIETFNFHIATRKLFNFIVDDFSRKYIKLIRDKQSNKKQNEYVIGIVLYNYIKLLAPFCPAIAEHIYLKFFKKFIGKKSIHLCSYPIPNKKSIDENLENEMKIIWEIISCSNSIRTEQNIKLRWPISKIIISANKKDVKNKIANNINLLKKMTNAKEIEFGSIESKISIKPDYKKLGPVFGNNTKKIAKLLQQANIEEIKEQYDSGKIKLGEFIIQPDMIIIQRQINKSIAAKEFSSGSVFIDTNFGNALIEEAFICDLMREIQILRKQAKLLLEDKINLFIESDAKEIKEIICKHKIKIEKETNSILVENKNNIKYYLDKLFKFGFKDKFKAEVKIFI